MDIVKYKKILKEIIYIISGVVKNLPLKKIVHEILDLLIVNMYMLGMILNASYENFFDFIDGFNVLNSVKR